MSKIVSFGNEPLGNVEENYLYGNVFKDKEISVYDKFYKKRSIYVANNSSYARYMDLNEMVSYIYLDSKQAKGDDFKNFVESRLDKEVKRESKRIEKLFKTLESFPENKEITDFIKEVTMNSNELTADIDGLKVNINHVSPTGRISLVKLSSRLGVNGFTRDTSEFSGDVNLSMTIGTFGIEADSIFGGEPSIVYKQEFVYKIGEGIFDTKPTVLTVDINHVSEDLGESQVIIQLFDRYRLELLYGSMHKLEDITDKFIPLKGDR